MRLPKKVNYSLLGLLILLTLSLRYDTFPYEKGSDSFVIHWLANTISEYGSARWVLDPLSLFGLYPFAYSPAGIPFFLSGTSQLTGIETELVILIIATFLGVFGSINSYLLAKEIKNDDLFAFFTAFFFSISYYLIKWTTWNISTRGFFIALLPLFIWSLLRCRRQVSRTKYICLAIILYFLLATTHRMVVLILPLIIFPFICTVILSHIPKNALRCRFTRNIISISLLISIALLFTLSVYGINVLKILGFSLHPMWAGMGRVFSGPSLIDPILTIGQDYAVYVNVVSVVVGFVGLISLIFKPRKNRTEVYICVVLLFSAPFFINRQYFIPVVLPILAVLTGYGFIFISKFLKDSKKKKMIFPTVLAVLFVSAMFSAFIIHLNSPQTAEPSPELFKGREESIYYSALWMKIYTEDGRTLFAGREGEELNVDIKIMSRNGINCMKDVSILISDPEFIDRFDIMKYSLIGILMYERGPFYGGEVYTYDIISEEYWGNKYKCNIEFFRDVELSESLVSEFDVRYVVGDAGRDAQIDSPLLERMSESRYKIYECGIIGIYYY